jgi:hypothetical protein
MEVPPISAAIFPFQWGDFERKLEYCDSGFRSLGAVVCDGEQSAIEKQLRSLKARGVMRDVLT